MSHPPRIPPSFVPTLTEVLRPATAHAHDPTEPSDLIFPVLESGSDAGPTEVALDVPVLEPLLAFPAQLDATHPDDAALAQAIEQALPLCLAQVLETHGAAWLAQWSQALVQELRQPLTDAVRLQLMQSASAR